VVKPERFAQIFKPFTALIIQRHHDRSGTALLISPGASPANDLTRTNVERDGKSAENLFDLSLNDLFAILQIFNTVFTCGDSAARSLQSLKQQMPVGAIFAHFFSLGLRPGFCFPFRIRESSRSSFAFVSHSRA